MKVKVIGNCPHSIDLEDDINQFLHDESPDVIDIKYQNYVDTHSDFPQVIYSALIMYEESVLYKQ